MRAPPPVQRIPAERAPPPPRGEAPGGTWFSSGGENLYVPPGGASPGSGRFSGEFFRALDLFYQSIFQNEPSARVGDVSRRDWQEWRELSRMGDQGDLSPRQRERVTGLQRRLVGALQEQAAPAPSPAPAPTTPPSANTTPAPTPSIFAPPAALAPEPRPEPAPPGTRSVTLSGIGRDYRVALERTPENGENVYRARYRIAGEDRLVRIPDVHSMNEAEWALRGMFREGRLPGLAFDAPSAPPPSRSAPPPSDASATAPRPVDTSGPARDPAAFERLFEAQDGIDTLVRRAGANGAMGVDRSPATLDRLAARLTPDDGERLRMLADQIDSARSAIGLPADEGGVGVAERDVARALAERMSGGGDLERDVDTWIERYRERRRAFPLEREDDARRRILDEIPDPALRSFVEEKLRAPLEGSIGAGVGNGGGVAAGGTPPPGGTASTPVSGDAGDDGASETPPGGSENPEDIARDLREGGVVFSPQTRARMEAYRRDRERLPDVVADIRAEANAMRPPRTIAARQNVAQAEFSLQGETRSEEGRLRSASGGREIPGFAPNVSPEEAILPPSFQNRANDTEYKVLNELARRLETDFDGAATRGRVTLFSEYTVCRSCANVILEFKRRYPLIDITVVAGERQRRTVDLSDPLPGGR